MSFGSSMERHYQTSLRPQLRLHRSYLLFISTVTVIYPNGKMLKVWIIIYVINITSFFCLFLKESEHTKMVQRRADQDAQTPEGLKSSPAVLEDSQLPLEQKKRKILRNLRNLEQAGLVTATNKFQDIINDIAKVENYFILSV